MCRLSGCLFVLVVVGSLGLVSCASLAHSGPEGVTITSEPPAAQVTITNLWTRQPILQATTPVLATLARHAGYMQPARYQIVIEKHGYQPYVLTLQAHLDEHYFGNLVASGPLGMFVIDPLTGAMYALPPRVHAVLARSDGAGAVVYPPRSPASPPLDPTSPPLAPDAPDGRRE
jgi:hypothetical protein